MGSSSKKKKRKKLDFQKTKLKIGKKLSKGSNITNTSFKARKIQIKEQLQPNIQDPILKQKANFNDLLKSLHHANVSRHSTLNELKVFLHTSPETILVNLSVIVETVGKFIEDRISSVRKAAFGVLKELVSHVSGDQMAPTFSVLSGYLCCAMTHLDPEIQTDSLELIDVLLDVYPVLMTSAQSQILGNFLEQISHQRAFVSRGTSSKNTERTLSVNPDNKLSRQEWRLKVLQRVQKFLRALLAQKSGIAAYENGNASIEYYYNPNHKLFVFPKPLHSTTNEYFTSISRLGSTKAGTTNNNIFHNGDNLKHFAKALMPLLFETWIEGRPSAGGKSSDNSLPAESTECLSCVLKVFDLVVELMEAGANDNTTDSSLLPWFRETYQADFLKHFMQHFPFSVQDKLRVKKKRSKDASHVLCHSLNLIICNVFTKIVLKMNDTYEPYWCSVVEFLIKSFKLGKSMKGTVDMKIAVDVLKSILGKQLLQGAEETVLAAVFETYKSCPGGSKNREIIMSLFSELVLNSSPDSVASTSETLSRWVMELPEALISGHSVPWAVLRVMQSVAPRNNEAFLLGLQRKSPLILELLSKITSKDAEPQKVHRALVELLLWCNQLSALDYKNIAKFVRDASVSLGVRLYCLQVLSLRYQKKPMDLWKSEASYYISFLLSLVTGHCNSACSVVSGEHDTLTRYLVHETDISDEAWKNHVILMEEVFASLKQFENSEQLNEVVACYVDRLLETNLIFSLHVVWSIFWLLDKTDCVISSTIQSFMLLPGKLAELAVASFRVEYKAKKCVHSNTLRFMRIRGVLMKVVGLILDLQQRYVKNLEDVAFICAVLSKVLPSYKLNRKELMETDELAKIILKLHGSGIESTEEWSSVVYELSSQMKIYRVQSNM